MSFDYSPAPARDQGEYGKNANSNRKRCSGTAQGYFKDGVKRARDRNTREKELDIRLEDPSKSSQREQLWADSGRVEGKYLRFLRTNDGPSRYTAIKTIGKGYFGEVKLVRRRQGGNVYALKRLLNTEMIAKQQLAYLRDERDVLAEAESEWVVKLYTTFQDSTTLYMLMEYLPGGDLMSLLIKFEVFTEDITRFYAAEIINGIEAVHKLGFIHRDIKPDNILLDRDGHIKLADFGLSTNLGGFGRADGAYTHVRWMLERQPWSQAAALQPQQNRQSVNFDEINLTVSNRSQINEWRRLRRLMAYSAVGTLDYIAPEILEGRGYSFDVDFWSVGAIIYECLMGWPPFASENQHDTMTKIINWQHTLQFPDDIQLSPNAVHLVRSLLRHSDTRLGRTTSAREVKNHPFFAGVNFPNLREIRAPFQPQLASDTDTSCFPVDDFPQEDQQQDSLTTTATTAVPALGDNIASLVQELQQQSAVVVGGGESSPPPEMVLPFVGYTFKRFEHTFG
ncbi:kinase-like domain-containing protein [Apodospora peruviana]|uniref:non-specific serine/threonine protein kinase n=1 Tax=Apodospora peruviana TaxID=516989 RepID=A0AAE0MC51_9PEZI|nr:kinase-like domain-containing protein [Apodospora peruviana]